MCLPDLARTTQQCIHSSLVPDVVVRHADIAKHAESWRVRGGDVAEWRVGAMEKTPPKALLPDGGGSADVIEIKARSWAPRGHIYAL